MGGTYAPRIRPARAMVALTTIARELASMRGHVLGDAIADEREETVPILPGHRRPGNVYPALEPSVYEAVFECQRCGAWCVVTLASGEPPIAGAAVTYRCGTTRRSPFDDDRTTLRSTFGVDATSRAAPTRS